MSSGIFISFPIIMRVKKCFPKVQVPEDVLYNRSIYCVSSLVLYTKIIWERPRVNLGVIDNGWPVR